MITDAHQSPPEIPTNVHNNANPFHENGVPIPGTEGLSLQEILAEIQKGGRFASPMYCISIIIMTFRRSLGLRFYRANESGTGKAFLGTLITGIVGWWGIPWGPIHSIGAIISNLRGGKDLTKDMLNATIGQPQTQSLMASRTKPKAGAGLWAMRAVVLGIPALLIFSIYTAGQRSSKRHQERLANDPSYAAYQRAEDMLGSGGGDGNTPEARTTANSLAVLMHTMVSASLKEDDSEREAKECSAYCHFTESNALTIVRIPDLRRFSDDAKGEILQSIWGFASQASSSHVPQGTKLTVALKGMALWEGALIGETGSPDAEDVPSPDKRIDSHAAEGAVEAAFTP